MRDRENKQREGIDPLLCETGPRAVRADLDSFLLLWAGCPRASTAVELRATTFKKREE